MFWKRALNNAKEIEYKFSKTLAQPSQTILRRPSLSLKGGDPAPPSGRATLLRLHPSHQPHLGRLSPLQVESTT